MIAFALPGMGEWLLLAMCGTVPIAVILLVAWLVTQQKRAQSAAPSFRFRINGSERTTGRKVSFELRCDSVDAARLQANNAGYVVETIDPLGN